MRLYIRVVVMGSTVILSTVSLKYRATCPVTNAFFLGFQEDDCPAQLWKEAEILMGWELGDQSACSISFYLFNTEVLSMLGGQWVAVTVAGTLVTQVNTE